MHSVSFSQIGIVISMHIPLDTFFSRNEMMTKASTVIASTNIKTPTPINPLLVAVNRESAAVVCIYVHTTGTERS